MRKRIAVFLCMMMVFAMTTGVAMAKVVEDYGQKDGNNFDVPLTGTYSKFAAKGENYNAYATIENTSTASKYLTCQVREYKINVGWTNSNSGNGVSLPGVQVSTSIIRQKSLIGYYFYGGYCYNDQSCSWVMDDYTYKAYQWYYESN